MAQEMVKFTDDGGKLVQFTAQDVTNLVCKNATQQEVALFLAHCNKHNLDPIGAKDAYLVKYGNNPAQIITGFQVFNRRANRAKDYAGIEDGVVVFSQQRGIEHRAGSAVYPELGEQLIGGWARVHFVGDKVPAYAEVALRDFNTGKSNWAKMPGVMIDKVAKATAWRLAYPDEFSGMYSAEEMEQAQTPTKPAMRSVEATVTPAQPAPAPQPQPKKSELTAETREFMRDASAHFAKAHGITANQAAHAIIDACGTPKDSDSYLQTVGDFVMGNPPSAQAPAEVVYDDADDGWTNN